MALAGARVAGSVRANAEADPTPDDAPPAAPLPTGPLDVTGYGPEGPTSSYQDVFVRFSDPMVPVGERKEGDPKALGFSIEPKIAGSLYWAEPTRLVFAPTDELAPATSYRVQFTGEAASIDGRKVDLNLDFEFESQRPTAQLFLEDDYGWGSPPDQVHWNSRVLIVPDDRMRLADIQRHAHAYALDADGARGREVPINVRRATRKEREAWGAYDRDELYVVRPATHWPLDTEVLVELDAKLRGRSGPLPLGTPAQLSFQINPGLVVTGVDCWEGRFDDGCALGPLQVYFNNPVSGRALVKRVGLMPKVEGGRAEPWGWLYPSFDRHRKDTYGSAVVMGKLELGGTYTVVVDPNLRDVHGQPLAGGEFRESVTFVPPPPTMQLLPRRGVFDPGRTADAGIEARYIEKVRVRWAVLDAADYERLSDQSTSNDSWPTAPLRAGAVEVPLKHEGQFGWTSQHLDLDQLTGGARGPVLVEVIPLALQPTAKGRKMPATQRGLFQLSSLGVSAAASLPASFAQVARLSDGAPVAGAKVRVLGPDGRPADSARTDKTGTARLPGQTQMPDNALLEVREGADRRIFRASALHADGETASNGLRTGESALTRITTERALYKPGEKVHVVGWAAIHTPYQRAGLRKLPRGTRVELKLVDVDGETVATRNVQAKSHGKYWATLRLPKSARLGRYQIEATVLGGSTSASVSVEDYRVPDFEVNAAVVDADVHRGDLNSVDVHARYYFGGSVKIARTRALTRCDVASHRPPGLEPEWRVGWSRTQPSYRPSSQLLTLVLDGEAKEEGHVRFEPPTDLGTAGHPYRCRASASVQDTTRQEVGAEASFMVHPDFYLAMANPSDAVAPQSIEIPVRRLDYDGRRMAGPVEVSLERVWYEVRKQKVDGREYFAGWDRKVKKHRPCKVTTTTSGADAVCNYADLRHGSYVIEVKAPGEGGYVAQTSGSFHLADPDYEWWRIPRPRPDRLEISLGEGTLEVGDSTVVRIDSPSANGNGILVLAAGGVRETHAFALADGMATVELQIDDAYVPQAELFAIVPGATPQKGRETAELQYANRRVEVGTSHRQLDVQVRAPTQAGPRDTIAIDVSVRDADEQPVPGHVSVWAVDEAVLSLKEHPIPDFVEAFAPRRTPGYQLLNSYPELALEYLLRGDPYHLWTFSEGGLGLIGTGRGGGGTGSGYGMGSGAGFGGRGSRTPNIAVAREKFETTPIFIGDAVVGEDGMARVHGSLPDNLTTFRITAVASAGVGESGVGRFGNGDTRIRVSRPLVARGAMPRVMRPGDRAQIAAVVDNLSGKDGELTVEVSLLDADERLSLESTPRSAVNVAAGGQVRLPFDVEALGLGEARVQIRARLTPSDGSTPIEDLLRLPLPVEAERTLTERVAVYGDLAEDRPAALPIELPANASRAHGGLSVSLSASLLGGLQDAVAYLVSYPYGCVEQTTSRMLPLVGLGEIARSFPIGDEAELDELFDVGVTRLSTMQTPTGGFAYWPGGTVPEPYPSAYATWVLGRADRAGMKVPAKMLDRARSYLRSETDAWRKKAAPRVREDVRALMAVQVLAEADMATAEDVAGVWERRRRLPVFARVLLWMSLHDLDPADERVATLERELMAYVDERNDSARIETDGVLYWDFFDSDARSSAMFLMGMLEIDPEHEIVVKLARGLMEAREGGRWSNTQENAYAVLAMAAYARVYEAEEADFEGRIWLSGKKVASAALAGRTFETAEAFTPMSELIDGPKARVEPLLLERKGTGRMYYRVGMEWANEGPVRAVERGIEIRRTLRGEKGRLELDTPLKAGELFAMDVVLEVRSDLSYVAVEVPLPAGLEAVNLDLGKGSAAMKLSGHRAYWVSHQELHRDRALLFANGLSPGKHTTTVFLRATTPGDYRLPAASAEMMYYPEIYGRTDAARVKVVE